MHFHYFIMIYTLGINSGSFNLSSMVVIFENEIKIGSKLTKTKIAKKCTIGQTVLGQWCLLKTIASLTLSTAPRIIMLHLMMSYLKSE